MGSSLKSLALLFPPLRRLHEERNRFALEVTRLSEHLLGVEDAYKGIQFERDRLQLEMGEFQTHVADLMQTRRNTEALNEIINRDLHSLRERVEFLENNADKKNKFFEIFCEESSRFRNEVEAHLLAKIDANSKRLDSLDSTSMHFSMKEIADSLANVSRSVEKRAYVVIVGRDFLGDNAKYFLKVVADKIGKSSGMEYRYLTEDRHQYDLLTSMGYQCILSDADGCSKEDINFLLKTQVVCETNTNISVQWKNPLIFSALSGATKIQMWHGIPLKSIELENIPETSSIGLHVAQIIESSSKVDHFVGTSTVFRAAWQSAFVFRYYHPIGYPRNDVLFREADDFDLLNVDIGAIEKIRTAQMQGKAICLYAPTFRDGDSGWIDYSTLEFIANNLLTAGTLLVVALHPFESHVCIELSAEVPSALVVNGRTDIYPLIPLVQLFVTDYSSLIFDCLLLDLPQVIYRPDDAYYRKHSRLINDDRLFPLPGPVVTSSEDFVHFATNGLVSLSADYADARATLRNRFFDNQDGFAGLRLWELVESILAEPSKSLNEMDR
jgi:CDP-glycerol glycerophosphotransferase (TagB/SpsB family)